MTAVTEHGYADPSTWRLETPGGVPYKLVDMSGSFSESTGTVNVVVLVESRRFIDFLEEMFPEPQLIGSLSVPRGFALGGAPGLIAQNVSFKSHVDGKPIDPFSSDTSAPTLTYFPVLELDIEFSPREKTDEPDEEDPTTFLEVSATAGGEFIHAGSSGVQFDGEQSRNPHVPLIVTVPTTEWTVKWPAIDFNYYKNVFQPRLRACLGKVNSSTVPWIYGATAETILFVGYSVNQRFTWKEGKIGTPPLDVEMKFVEKRIVWQGQVIGHNHFWETGKGWKRVLIDSGSSGVYELINMNALFAIQGSVLD